MLPPAPFSAPPFTLARGPTVWAHGSPSRGACPFSEKGTKRCSIAAGLPISGTGNLYLNYCIASKLFPSHAALGQHQSQRSDNRQQMSGNRSVVLQARPGFSVCPRFAIPLAPLLLFACSRFSWRRRPARAHELGLMHAQRVAGLVQAVGVRQMRVEQREHMPVCTECSGVDLELARQFWNQVPRNQVASLPESGMITSRWPGCRAFAGAGRLAAPSTCVYFHVPVSYRHSAARSAFFMPMG